jgi:hypothetical protein
VTPQLTSAALSSGTSGSILITDASFSTWCSAKDPMSAIGAIGTPSRCMNASPPPIGVPAIRYLPRSHRFCCPVAHQRHLPQLGMKLITT